MSRAPRDIRTMVAESQKQPAGLGIVVDAGSGQVHTTPMPMMMPRQPSMTRQTKISALQDDDKELIDMLQRRLDVQRAELENRTDSIGSLQRNFESLSSAYVMERKQMETLEREHRSALVRCSELEALLQEYLRWKDEAQRLSNEAAALKTSHEHLVHAHRSEVGELERKCAALEHRSAGLEGLLEARSEDDSKSALTIQQLRTECKSLEKKVLDADRKFRQLEESYAIVDNELLRLRKEVDLNKGVAQFEVNRSVDIARRLDEADALVVRLRDQLALADSRDRKCSAEMFDMKQRFEKTETEHLRLQSLMRSKEEQLARCSQELAAAQHSTQQTLRASEDQRRSFLSDLQSSQQKLAEACSELAKLRSMSQSENASMACEATKLRQEVQKLQADVEAKQKSLSVLSARSERLSAEAEEQLRTNKALQSQLDELRLVLAQERALTAQLQSANVEGHSSFESRIASLSDENASLTAQLADLRKECTDATEQLAATGAVLEEREAELEFKVRQLKHATDQALDSDRQLRRQKSSTDGEVASLQKSLAEARTDAAKYEAVIRQQGSELARLKAESDAHRSTLAAQSGTHEQNQMLQRELRVVIQKLIATEQAQSNTMTCMSCMEILNDPVMLIPCGHSCCLQCLEKAQQKAGSTGPTSCGECEHVVESFVKNQMVDLIVGKAGFRQQSLASLLEMTSKLVL